MNNRRRIFTYPNYSNTNEYYNEYDEAVQEYPVGGSYDSGRDGVVGDTRGRHGSRAPGGGRGHAGGSGQARQTRLEAATLNSEISMSIVTDVTRQMHNDRYMSEGCRGRRRRAQSQDENSRRCCGIVNVEPVMLLLAIAMGLMTTSQPLFTYWARCVEIAGHIKLLDGADDNVTSICSQLAGSNETLQDLVETDISSMKIWIQVANSVPTLIVAPMVGTWSDKTGRKFPLLFTISGMLIYSVLQCMATLTYTNISIYIWYFTSEIFMGMMGSVTSMFATILSIVTDDSRHVLKPGSSSVPLRIGIASFVQVVGTLIGTLIFSYFLSYPSILDPARHVAGYVNAAFLQVFLILCALLYSIFCVSETHFPVKEGFPYSQFHNMDGVSLQEPHQPKTYASKIKENMCGLADVIWEKRPGWTRCCLILSLLFVFVEFLALDNALLLLFTKRQPFAWADKTFGYYSLTKGCLFAIGMVLCPVLLSVSSWLGKDSLMVIIGISASCASFFMISQATTTQEIFMTTILSILCGAISPGYRSFLPRMVAKEQTARLFTICSIILALCPIVSNVVFNNLYNWSMDWWAGFAFFVGGIVQLVVVFGQITVHMLMRPQWQAAAEAVERAREEREEEIRNNDEEGDMERSESNTAVGSDLQVGSLEDELNFNLRTNESHICY